MSKDNFTHEENKNRSFHFVDFKIFCPRDLKEYDSQMQFAVSDTGEEFPLPCNGCDNMSGEKVCQECTTAITLMFYNKKIKNILEPVTPNISDSIKK